MYVHALHIEPLQIGPHDPDTPRTLHYQNDHEGGRLGNEGGSGSRVVLERRGDLLLGLVVTSKTVDTRLDQDETELGVLVLAVGLEVLADGDSLFDEVPEVLGDLGSKT